METGQTCRGQQLREAALRLPRFQRNAIQQKLVIRNAQQKSRIACLRQRRLQFIPGSLELAFGSLVVQAIQPRVLHKNVQAVDKGPRGRGAALVRCAGGSDKPLLWMLGYLVSL